MDWLEPLLELLLEVLFEALLPLLAELWAESVTTVVETYSILRADCSVQREDRGPVLAGAGCLIMGAAVGLNTLWLFPDRLTPPTHMIPGLSMLLAPLAAGLAMHCFGIWRREHGGCPTRLATFWAGSLFGFGAAAARFVMVGR